jgi:phospholipid/cholesterol/gamma-HCH transport system ATP-binding protein
MPSPTKDTLTRDERPAAKKSGKPLIVAENLFKRFGDLEVLNGMDLTINEGEVIVIIGRSGCGKSVFLKHLMRIMRPDRGHIFFENVDINRLDEQELTELRKNFGMLFQGAALFDSLSVAENVGFYFYEYSKLPQSDIDKIVAEKLALVGLSGVQEVFPAELSGGMKKRVGLARAIATEPRVILYDEPTTGLDPIMADVINELILDLQKKLNITSIVVTHDMVSAYKIATRIAMLYEGKIIAVGSPQEIRNSKNPFVQQFITGSSHGPIDVLTG